MNQKLEKVKAEYEQQVQAELARDGPDGAERFKKKIATNDE